MTLDNYFDKIHNDNLYALELDEANEQARRDYEDGMLSRLEHELLEQEAKDLSYAYYRSLLGL